MSNKTTAIYDFIVSNDLDIFAVTESWMKGKGNDKVERIYEHEILPKTHHMINMPRPDGRKGGGIAVFHRKELRIEVLESSGTSSKQFEYAVCLVKIDKVVIRLIVVYRPVPTKANKLNKKLFWKDFENFIDKHACCSEEIIITGDLNFHLDKPSHPDTLHLNCLLEEYNLIQKIEEPTHSAGHTLDIFVIREDCDIITSYNISHAGLCNDDGKVINDHYAVHWSLSIIKLVPEIKEISFRNIKGIDYESMLFDISQSELSHISCTTELSADQLVTLYNHTLLTILNKHAPLITKSVRSRSNTEWYTNDMQVAKREKRQAERLWRRTGLTIHRKVYLKKCANMNKRATKAKLNHFSSKVIAAGRNQKAIHKIANSLTGGKIKNVLPSSDCQLSLANRFSKFFKKKVEDIRKDLKDALFSDNEFIPVISKFDSVCQNYLAHFQNASVEEITKFILESNNKNCELDPIPTIVLKKAIHLLAPFITLIINKTFSEGSVPISLKEALVRPALKKPSLDPDQIKNYRPVSNLPYLSKILEKTVNSRLDSHLEGNGLLDIFQSAYRKGHSTETALLRIVNDVLLALDEGKATLLIMLDVSAAFDVVDHERLLDRHNKYFGITEKALDWMSSYLKDRKQSVKIESKQSEIQNVESGFPQGSVLGGTKYIMYESPLANLLDSHDVEHHYYADDGSVYTSFMLQNQNEVQNAIIKLELCLSDVYSWMTANMLKMNDDKTEVILFAPKKLLSGINEISIRVNSEIVHPKSEVESLGVMLDATLNMKKQIISVTKSCYYNLRNISKIRKYLTQEAAKSLVNSTVISKLDYCNSLLSGIPKYLVKKLQRVQNYAARLVKKSGRRGSITRQLKDLHWLPVLERIQFKVLLVVYKSLNGLAPMYLRNLLDYYNPGRTLRSSNRHLLIERRFSSKFGSRSFTCIAPRMWNKLPLDIRNAESVPLFKTKLKTYFFNKVFTEL